jgi:ABC-type sulfate/molybdate transport systems ATPase subunit
MKQRVAIARGMAMEPDVLLMDEPFAALDALTRVRMQDELLALWDETKFTVIFVTHSIPEAIKIGNRILLLTPHPGQVNQGGLGWYIFEAKNQLDIPEVFAGLLSIILIGLFIENVVFRLIEMKTVRRWGMQS